MTENEYNNINGKKIKLDESNINNNNIEKNNNVEYNKMIKLGTHSGAFHCDEVMGMVLLKCLKKYKNAEIIRSREKNILDKCDVVIDVGGEFNIEKCRFDHHQKYFNEYFDENRKITKLSSAGLVYKYMGKDILKDEYNICEEGVMIINENNEKKIINKDENIQNVVYNMLYKILIEMIDAIDNGVSIGENIKYIDRTNLPSRVSRLNKSWDEEEKEKKMNRTEKEIEEDEYNRFYKAMSIVKEELDSNIKYLVNTFYPAKKYVKEAVMNRYNYDKSGRIVVKTFLVRLSKQVS